MLMNDSGDHTICPTNLRVENSLNTIMALSKHRVFIISDSTAITAETLGRSLLAQFPSYNFEFNIHPYVKTLEEIDSIIEEINTYAELGEIKPVVFSTLTDPVIRKKLGESKAKLFDPFDAFLSGLSQTFKSEPIGKSGLFHSTHNREAYTHRIEAVDYSLQHDDGVGLKYLDSADLILLGVSRTAKTPTSLYLAMQFSIRCANYPLTPDDMESEGLPRVMRSHKDKLFGLTTEPKRLHAIRQERRANSQYSSLAQCEYELKVAENIYKLEGIPYINTENKSIEEIAATIMHKKGLKR